MRRFILGFVLLAASAVANADWAHVGNNANGDAFLWYPVNQYFPWAYPTVAAVFYEPHYIKGWRYRARSQLIYGTVDCRDLRAKMRYGYFYAGYSINGSRAKIAYMYLSNGLKVVPGRWYAYSRFPALERKAIRWSCD